jgi:hypothetical protein
MRNDRLMLHDERLVLWPARLLYDFRELCVRLRELLETPALLQLEDERALLRREHLLSLREDNDESESLLLYLRLELTRLFLDITVAFLPLLQPSKKHKKTSQFNDQLFLAIN